MVPSRPGSYADTLTLTLTQQSSGGWKYLSFPSFLSLLLCRKQVPLTYGAGQAQKSLNLETGKSFTELSFVPLQSGPNDLDVLE